MKTGFPHSEISGYYACLSAYPSLSQTSTSFIAFYRLGIHRMRLVTWPYNPKQPLAGLFHPQTALHLSLGSSHTDVCSSPRSGVRLAENKKSCASFALSWIPRGDHVKPAQYWNKTWLFKISALWLVLYRLTLLILNNSSITIDKYLCNLLVCYSFVT